MENLETADKVIVIIGFILILAWLVLVTIWIQRMMNKFTFFNWKRKNNPYKNETLGMPVGTLRGMLTLTLLVVFIILVCVTMVVEEYRSAYDGVTDAFKVMLAFYFGSRVMSQVTESDKEKAKTKAESEERKAIAQASANSNVVESEFYVPGSKG